MERQEVISFLEGLVGQRFNMQSLNDKLEKVFNQKVELQNTSLLREQENDDDDLADYNLMFNIEDGSEQSGFFDIYMLPMRRKGFDDADMYITEVGYEFG
jgi:hypothetical protein|tara:strand:+ start:3025 stop:3324 length:300 start_codon:yes stop_codon:yes gene_type:complete